MIKYFVGYTGRIHLIVLVTYIPLMAINILKLIKLLTENPTSQGVVLTLVNICLDFCLFRQCAHEVLSVEFRLHMKINAIASIRILNCWLRIKSPARIDYHELSRCPPGSQSRVPA